MQNIIKAIFALFTLGNEGALKTLAKMQSFAKEDASEGTKHLSLLVPVLFTAKNGKQYFGFYRPDDMTDKKNTIKGIRNEWSLDDSWTIEYGQPSDWKKIISWSAPKAAKKTAKKKTVNLLDGAKKAAKKTDKKAKLKK